MGEKIACVFFMFFFGGGVFRFLALIYLQF